MFKHPKIILIENMNSGHPARSLLAMVGADLTSVDKSFTGDYRYGDSTGNRTSALASIENVDAKLRRQVGLESPSQNIYYEEPRYIPQNNIVMNTPKLSREDRINKLLGKTQSAPVQEVVYSDEYTQMVAAIQKAIEPITEHLEDIAVLNGLFVQKMEELIKLVSPEGEEASKTESFLEEQFNESMEPMEVYNPEVSMSIVEDEGEEIQVKSKKKVKKK